MSTRRPAPPWCPAPRASPSKPPVVKPIVNPTSPRAGASWASKQERFAKQQYAKALAACERRYPGNVKDGRAQRAGCRRQAKATHRRKIALIKCSKTMDKRQTG
jgi:hypothetical protein